MNDHVQIAKQLDLDGVHLGKEDMKPCEARCILGKDKIIGATCNTLHDILKVSEQPIDYIGLGPFHYTTTKKKLSPTIDLSSYKSIISDVRQQNIQLPIFAIGGIVLNDIDHIMSTGVNGIAVSGVIKNSENMLKTTQKILEQLYNANINHSR